MLFTSDASGVPNAYTVPVRWRYRIAPNSLDDRIDLRGLVFSRRTTGFCTRTTRGGNENNHLYVLAPSGETDLTPGPKLKAMFGGWSRDESAFYVLTNERDPRFFDLYRYDAAKLERALIYKDKEGYQVAAVSGDGRWVALGKPQTTADADIYVWDTRDTPHVPLHAAQEARAVLRLRVRPRLQVALLPDQCWGRVHPRQTLRAVNRQARGCRVSRLGHPFHQVLAERQLSGDGHQRGRHGPSSKFTTRTPGSLFRCPGCLKVTLPRSSFLATRQRMVVTLERRPLSQRTCTRAGSTRPVATALTSSLSKEIDPEDLVEAKVVRFKASDGLTIPSIFYKPHQASPENKVPALVWVHGGPGGQTPRATTHWFSTSSTMAMPCSASTTAEAGIRSDVFHRGRSQAWQRAAA